MGGGSLLHRESRGYFESRGIFPLGEAKTILSVWGGPSLWKGETIPRVGEFSLYTRERLFRVEVLPYKGTGAIVS